MLLLIFFFFFFFFSSCWPLLSLDILNLGASEFLNFISLSFSISYFKCIFLFMVLMVSFFVYIFSGFYMEGYNMSKYFFFKNMFFFSMISLCLSNSPFFMFLSWDYLGLTSIFLVLFYPNKNNLISSIWIMFYNRLGDLFMIFIFINLSFDLFLHSCHLNFFCSFFTLICIFTKSAQLPFSIWLPLAMSAPTPISAMVHSSTLVTAGIYIVVLYLDCMSYFATCALFLSSCVSFLLGGFLATKEKDFKKIIAFSTMSQISMSIFSISCGMLCLGLFHMFLHSLFKSMMFMSSGYLFLSNFSDQNSAKIGLILKNTFIKFFVFYSIFSMSGLSYSMSFFSKDLMLEISSTEYQGMIVFFIILLGSAMTMLYSSCMLKSMIKMNYSMSFKSIMFTGYFIFFMYFLTLFIIFLLPALDLMFFSLVGSDLVSFVSFFMCSCLIFFYKIEKFLFMLDSLFLKMFFFMEVFFNLAMGLYGCLFFKDHFFSDLTMFKKNYLRPYY